MIFIIDRVLRYVLSDDTEGVCLVLFLNLIQRIGTMVSLSVVVCINKILLHFCYKFLDIFLTEPIEHL